MEVMLQPRIIRAGQAPNYCGMGRELFSEQIRPFVSEIEMGKQGVGFDRLELDAALDEYISRRGRAPAQKWSDTKCRKMATVSAFGAAPGTSRNELTDGGFAKALDQAVG
jgi:hypothetical protein